MVEQVEKIIHKKGGWYTTTQKTKTTVVTIATVIAIFTDRPNPVCKLVAANLSQTPQS